MNPITNPQQKLEYLDELRKAAKDADRYIKKIDKSLSQSTKRGLTYDYLNNIQYNNVVYPRNKIPDRLLRLVEVRNPVVGAVVTLRLQQLYEFSNITHDKDTPGWEVVLKDSDATLNSKRKGQKQFLEEFISCMRLPDHDPITNDHQEFKQLLTAYGRDRILIDKCCYELQRDKSGKLVCVWVLDGATILPVLPGGYVGSTSHIGAGLNQGITKLSEKLSEARIDAIPSSQEIEFVQELIYGTGGGIVAAFGRDDILYSVKNQRNDIQYYKQGFSVVEKANLAIVAFINSLRYNSNGLSRSAIPKIGIAMGKESGYTQEQLEDMQDEWMANFEGEDGQWNIPILNGDAKVLNMLPSNRDMEYQKYLEFTGALTASVMGTDLAEVGLRFNQAQSVLSENQDAKQKFSKSRALYELLGMFSDDINKILNKSGYDFAKDWIFRFNGLNPTDKGFEVDLKTKKVSNYKTIDEIRAENDDPPLEKGGNIILNPQYLQYIQSLEMQEQQGAEGGEQEDDDSFDTSEFEDDIDETVDEMIKAKFLI